MDTGVLPSVLGNSAPTTEVNFSYSAAVQDVFGQLVCFDLGRPLIVLAVNCSQVHHADVFIFFGVGVVVGVGNCHQAILLQHVVWRTVMYMESNCVLVLVLILFDCWPLLLVQSGNSHRTV